MHDIFARRITEALKYTTRYEWVAKAYYRSQVSMMIEYGECPYVVRIVISYESFCRHESLVEGSIEVNAYGIHGELYGRTQLGGMKSIHSL